MEQFIKTEKTKTGECAFGENGFVKKELLIGEVPGVEINYYIVKKGCTYYEAEESGKARVVLFVRGIGYIEAGDSTFTLSEIAAFCPPPEIFFTLYATSADVEFLEILYELKKDEIKELSGTRSRRSYFINYSACTTYKEAIKSEKTINRTLIPDNIIPRFCMGSVETKGPDNVGAHKHPMLEQFFFGLSDNYCYTIAGDSEALFEENTLLHIPLGSTHGVRVENGYTLHYIWIDLFKGNDMSYIHESHIQNSV